MANNFLTVQEIASESLVRLRNNLVFAQLVHRDFSQDFATRGDTIQVRKPATFTAEDFSSSTSTQDIEEESVLVTMDRIADVTVEVTSRQLTQNIEEFGDQVVEGAMQAIAQKIDNNLASLYTATPYTSGDAGNDPDALSDVANARKVLNNNKVPMGNRRLVVDPDAEANLLVLDSVHHAEKAGTTDALREASMGRLMGFDTFMNQNIVTHEKGDLATSDTDDFALESTYAAGTTTIKIEPSGDNDLTGSLKKGDILIIDGNQYAVQEDADANTTDDEIEVKIYPGLLAEESAGTEVEVMDNHTANMAFHRDGIVLVNRPMALPMGGAEGYVAEFEGLSIRATMGYSMSSKINEISFDILYGMKVVEPKMVARIFGTA